jgi:SSS family solute:Na+ symporter
MVALTVAVAFLIDLFPTGLWDAYYISSGVLSAGVGVPVLGMFWKRSTTAGALAGSFVGAVTAFVGYFVEFYVLDGVYSPQWLADTALGYAFVAVVAGLVVFVVVSLLTPGPTEKQLAAIGAGPVDDHDEFFRGVAETG